MEIPAAEDYLQALIDKDHASARFLPTIRFAPSYMSQGKSSIGASILRQAHPAESGLRHRVLKALRVAVENLTTDLQQIDQLGIRMAAT
jgi:hypothetical protein